eukprot:gb/GECG01011859.1/.p1 GENE.gb/GECG01011859.1/~~gb/GECG01011859.1/.p1  ORF type:complete len:1244 (+),score=127.55 gb/GECG01011859.1/:1-3732(+)
MSSVSSTQSFCSGKQASPPLLQTSVSSDYGNGGSGQRETNKEAPVPPPHPPPNPPAPLSQRKSPLAQSLGGDGGEDTPSTPSQCSDETPRKMEEPGSDEQQYTYSLSPTPAVSPSQDCDALGGQSDNSSSLSYNANSPSIAHDQEWCAKSPEQGYPDWLTDKDTQGSNSTVPLSHWRKVKHGGNFTLKERLRHKFTRTSDRDCSTEFHNANNKLKRTRSKAERLYEVSQNFKKASAIYASALRTFTQELLEVTQEMAGEEDASAFSGNHVKELKTSMHQTVSQFNQLSHNIADFFISPMDNQIGPQLVTVRETKRECYTALHERNSLAKKIEDLAKSSKLGTGTNKLSDLQARHRQAADRFIQLHQDTICRAYNVTSDIRGVFVKALRSSLKMQSEFSQRFAGYASDALECLPNTESTEAPIHRSSSLGGYRASIVDGERPSSWDRSHGKENYLDIVHGGNLIKELRSRGYLDDDVALRCTLTNNPGTCPLDFATATKGMIPPVIGAPLYGETVLMVFPRVCEQTSGQLGTLVASSYRLRFCPFIPREIEKALGSASVQDVALVGAVSIPLRSISQMSPSFNKSNRTSSLTIWCHNLRYVIFNFFHTEHYDQATRTEGSRHSSSNYRISGKHVTDTTENAPHAVIGGSNIAGTLMKEVGPHVWKDNPEFALNYRLPSLSDDLPSVLTLAKTAYSHLLPYQRQKIKTIRNENCPALSAILPFDGWGIYTWEQELQRLHQGDSFWRLTDVNHNYELSATYPDELLVPRCVSDATLRVCAQYRSKKRLPAVVWAFGPVCLARAAQPMPGMFGSHSAEDEALLGKLKPPSEWLDERFRTDEAYLRRQRGGAARIAMYDARPRVNAVSNKTKGGGSESISRYSESSLHFLGIPNIHVVRDALVKFRASIVSAASHGLHRQEHLSFSLDESALGTNLSEAETANGSRRSRVQKLNGEQLEDLGCAGKEDGHTYTDVETALSYDVAHNIDIERMEWMKLVSTLLHGGYRLALDISYGTSVFVHCSDGWDRTAELAGLVQLILDPYYRTLAGFCKLVEKEWCIFGHQFSRRSGTGCGHSRKNYGDKQRSPVFLQFLDAVWQLVNQRPSQFEFNGKLLMLLAEHIYSGRFGTFLYDCPRVRLGQERMHERSESIWMYVARYAYAYRNPGYELPRDADEAEYHRILAQALPWSENDGGEHAIRPEGCFFAGALVTQNLMKNASKPGAYAVWPREGGSLSRMDVWPYWFHRWVS